MANFDKETILSSDSEGPGSFLPPPRIAARFSRSTASAARRKSSAASSRRNSMSSHHSSKSVLSAHGGPQSTHIAQHLRRASLLESRKARLAEKAAHAEKVRLRAAMAKAAPRLNANSEERALAAKQARDKYLAQVAANCHEEVKRAKKIAEDAREKKAAEHLRMKGVMEDRLAEAEKRRILYQQNQRRPKNTGLQSVDEKRVAISAWKPRSEVEAAKFLQRAWKNRQRRKFCTELVQIGLTTEATRAASFEDMGSLLNHPTVLTCAAKILEFYGLHEREAYPISEKGAIRTFLSAFLILGHPNEVLSKDGVQEQDLVTKANIVLDAFEQLIMTPLPHPGFSPNYPQLVLFSEAYSAFLSAFAAWRDHDSSILVSTMVAQFVELDAIWQSVKNDTAGGVADDYRVGIQQNQTLILVRLKRLLGSEGAMARVKKAIQEARRAKMHAKRAKPTRQSRPRGDSSILNVIPQQKPARLTSEDILHRGPRTRQETLVETLKVLPGNRTIVHELAINKEYRLTGIHGHDVRRQWAQTLSRNMQEAMDHGLGDAIVVEIVQVFRDKLLGLVAPGKSMHRLISETLDPSMIATRVKMGAFSYQKFFEFINSILPQLCAPARDTDVKALAEDPSQDPSELFAHTNEVLNLLLLDHANFSLQVNAPMLLAEAPAYEKRCFQEIFGASPPPKMKSWWRDASSKYRADWSRRNPETDILHRLTPEKIYMEGLTDLVIAVHPLDRTELPESLELDVDRISQMRSIILRLITIEAILLTAKNLLKRDIRSPWKSELQRMLPLSYDEPQAFSAAIPHTLPPNTKTILSGTIERVLADAKVGRVTHAVTRLLLQRIKSHVFNCLTAASADERILATATASEKLTSCGLIEVVSHIGGLSDEIKNMADVDRAAHGQWYDRIIASGEA